MEAKLDGRTAVITGGSKGIGLAIATQMAASGADIAILARRPDVLEEARTLAAATARGQVIAIPCDVSKAEEVARA
jgi:NAD(P)-dependent dehydrogenase (short-subunit alcohol dehydrogenase family)